MDWDATPWADVLAALREADWSGTRPRPVAETLAGLGPPPHDPAELGGRLKCNAWCYRATYGLAVAAPPVQVPLIPFVRFGVPPWGWARAIPTVLGKEAWDKLPHVKRLFDESNARPAAQRANAFIAVRGRSYGSGSTIVKRGSFSASNMCCAARAWAATSPSRCCWPTT